jgi:hypothetical protein
MKKFKLVFWSDCRGMEIDSVSIIECSNGSEVVEYLIGKKVDDESWVDYVNDLLNLGSSDIDWVEDKSKWEDMFVMGDVNSKVFEVDFRNELNSCLVVREDSEYFDRDFDLDLLEEVENKYVI